MSIIPIEDEEALASLVQEGKPLIAWFMATWSGPCKLIAPSIEELATSYSDRFKVCSVDVDNNLEISQRFSIELLPTVLFFKQGQLVDTLIGVSSEEDFLTRRVEQLLMD